MGLSLTLRSRAREAYKRFGQGPKPGGGRIDSARAVKAGAPEAAPLGNNPTKPAYVNTVWGYGYKWGS